MTRRRFVRLLMAKRVSRNMAMKYAKRVQKSGLPYAVAYSRFFWVDFEVTGGDSYRAALKKVDRTVRSFGNELASIQLRALTREEHAAFHELFRRNQKPYIMAISTAGSRTDWLPVALIGWDLANENRWEKKKE